MMKWLVLALAAVLALTLGGTAALLGGEYAAILLVMLVFLALPFCDYRAGVVILTLTLPFSASPLLPSLKGFNTFNYLVAATLMAFLLQRVFRRTSIVWPPKIFWWCYVLPICVAVLIGFGHLAEARQNFVLRDAAILYQPINYLKQHLETPLFFIVYAFLLANAVRASKRPERFLVALGVAAILPTVVIAATIAMLRVDLSALQSNREYLTRSGLHANEFGLLLAIASGPLLYLMASSNGAAKLGFAMAFALVLAGLMVTFSRGAYTAFFAVLIIFLYERRRVRTIIASVLIGGVILLAGPAAFRDRVTTGADADALIEARSGDLRDPLTAGRIGIYFMLAPDIARSPIWGGGAGSTVWTHAARSGRYGADHPHNLYLEILLDVGLLGFATQLYLYYRYWSAMRSLSSSEELSTSLRGYFAGSAAALVGLLVMGFSNGRWMPHPDQSYLWFALGMAFAYWPVAERARHSDSTLQTATSPHVAAKARRGGGAWIPGRYQ